MKGVVFNLLEDFVTTKFGFEVLERILERCPAHQRGPFVGPETYPDTAMMGIVEATCHELDLPLPVACRAFGRFAFPGLASRFPVFVEGHRHPRTFLASVEDIIHLEVRKLLVGSKLPSFTYLPASQEGLRFEYRSSRNLCWLAEGLIDGVADHFGVPIDQGQSSCVHRGDAVCTFELSFAPVVA